MSIGIRATECVVWVVDDLIPRRNARKGPAPNGHARPAASDGDSFVEYSSATDELHVSHSVAPNPRTGQIVYSALVVLRPRG